MAILISADCLERLRVPDRSEYSRLPSRRSPVEQPLHSRRTILRVGMLEHETAVSSRDGLFRGGGSIGDTIELEHRELPKNPERVDSKSTGPSRVNPRHRVSAVPLRAGFV